jgi:hypothetical protein
MAGKKGELMIVRLDQMTDAEIEREAREREARGQLEHAAELRQFADMRRRGRSPEDPEAA